MHQTQTKSQTTTGTQAKRLASRIGAELLQFQSFYGKPDRDTIDQYIVEVELFLANDYLRSIQYGFKRDDRVIFDVEYTAREASGIDEKPGRVPPRVDTVGATWFSYLRYSDRFFALSRSEQQAFQARSPLQRSGAPEPRLAAGLRSASVREFSEETLGLRREIRLA